MTTIEKIAAGFAIGLVSLWALRKAQAARGTPISSLDGTTPVSTLASAWRATSPQQSAWMRLQQPTLPPGGGLSNLIVRGYGDPGGIDYLDNTMDPSSYPLGFATTGGY